MSNKPELSGIIQPVSDNNAGDNPTTPLRFVTAASLFDGHDAAINIMRRLIQAQGCEVIHLGHNRSVLDIVNAAIQEDADAVAISSYQGGHNEYFRFMIDQLKERGAQHIQVFGGGGGTITLDEISALQDYGVNRIYHPDDGMGLGLVEMIEDVVQRAGKHRREPAFPRQPRKDNASDIAQVLTALEVGIYREAELIDGALERGSDPRVTQVRFVPLEDLERLTLYPDMRDSLLSAMRRHFPDHAVYLGNLWRD